MSETKLQRSPLVVIFFTIFIDLLGFGIVLPLSPYYAEHFGATATAVGLLQASYSLMQFIFAPLWGRISDRVGRRPIILMSIFGGFVSFFIFACASQLWVLFAARMLQGVFGANISATQAYVADVTSKKDRSKGMGLIGAAFGLGFILGPAIGAFLSQSGPSVGALIGFGDRGPFGMGFPALVASLMCLANFSLAYFKLPESLKPENRNKETVRKNRFHLLAQSFTRPQAGWLILIFFCSSFAMANMESTLALFTESRLGYGIRETGKLFALVGVMIAFTQGYLIRKLLPKLGERKMIVIGPLLAGIGLTAIGLITNTPELYLANIFLAVGSGISNPAILGGISLVTEANEQGEIMGITQSLGSLARILGPTFGGFIFANIAPAAPYFVAGFFTFAAMLLALKNAKRLPNAGHVDVAAIH